MLKAREQIVWRIVDGETLILDTRSGDYFSLNGTGTTIWSLFNDGLSRTDVAQELVRCFDVVAEEALADIDSITTELVSQGIVEQTA